MKARDVLVDTRHGGHEHLGEANVRRLLATTPEGEGVYIAPDGTLMRVELARTALYHYRLVPIEGADRE